MLYVLDSTADLVPGRRLPCTCTRKHWLRLIPYLNEPCNANMLESGMQHASLWQLLFHSHTALIYCRQVGSSQSPFTGQWRLHLAPCKSALLQAKHLALDSQALGAPRVLPSLWSSSAACTWTNASQQQRPWPTPLDICSTFRPHCPQDPSSTPMLMPRNAGLQSCCSPEQAMGMPHGHALLQRSVWKLAL